MHTHFWAVIVLTALIVSYGLYLYHRYQSDKLAFTPAADTSLESPVAEPRHWLFIRWEGGGSIAAPDPMTESDAQLWCARNYGRVAYVDKEHAFIFYRPN